VVTGGDVTVVVVVVVSGGDVTVRDGDVTVRTDVTGGLVAVFTTVETAPGTVVVRTTVEAGCDTVVVDTAVETTLFVTVWAAPGVVVVTVRTAPGAVDVTVSVCVIVWDAPATVTRWYTGRVTVVGTTRVLDGSETVRVTTCVWPGPGVRTRRTTTCWTRRPCVYRVTTFLTVTTAGPPLLESAACAEGICEAK
jgi:hypothetical protein